MKTKDSIKVIIEELAHQELIQKANYVSNVFGGELEALKLYHESNNFSDLQNMYAAKKPSSKRVIKLLPAGPKTESEGVCFDHLKRYIKSLNENTFAAFLQFITGIDITVEKIDVSFNTTGGSARVMYKIY